MKLQPIHYDVLRMCDGTHPMPWGLIMFLSRNNPPQVGEEQIEQWGLAKRELTALGMLKVEGHFQGAIYRTTESGKAALSALAAPTGDTR